MPTELKELFDKFAAGTATEDETKKLFALMASGNYDQELTELHLHELENTQDPAIAYTDGWYSNFEKLKAQARHEEVTPVIPIQRRSKSWFIPAAAVFLIALATAIYFYRGLSSNGPDVLPGGNKATLTLADGTKIDLDSAQSGIIIADEDIKYNNGNNVLSEKGKGPRASGTYNVERITYNSLSTPKGGQYQVILEDGTKVWLNAASTLKYPSRFSGAKRDVFLEGEAFFDIKQDKTKSFKVISKSQEILVLGTSFNVSAYADEANERTTLVEGKVQVKTQNLQRKTYNVQLLALNQQAVVKGDSLTVSNVNVESETAWRDGLFAFNDEPLESVMKKVARWYNVDVVYGPGVNKQDLFGGSISRYEKVSSVLKKLELTGGIRCRVDKERRIIIEKKE